MAILRRDTREVQFKVVYCGPPLGGKTSNLTYVHRRLDPAWRGDLVSIATEQNRTITFDFLPLNAMAIRDYQARFQLYTVPGQNLMRETRRAVLAGADGVVFVADSRPEQFEANLEAYQDCCECLEENHIDPEAIPFVFQYNKRDVPGATAPEDLDELLEVRSPSFLASAISGYQVFAALDSVTRKILEEYRERMFSIEPTPRERSAAPSSTVGASLDG